MSDGRGAPAPGKGKAHEARRTCVACREEEARDDLLRLVRAPEGEAVVDLRARLPGRGAWVHPRAACVDAIEADPRLLARALDAPTDVTGLGGKIRDAVLRALLDGLSLAAAGGGLVGGHDAIEAAGAEGRLVALIVATDAAERTLNDLRRAAPDVPVTPVPLDRATLGERVGQAPRAALGVVASSASKHLRRQLRRLAGLG